jgi:polyphosphate kinase
MRRFRPGLLWRASRPRAPRASDVTSDATPVPASGEDRADVPGRVDAAVHERRSETVEVLTSHGTATDDAPHRFINRELSWLQFNERVLAMAEDATVPLLERVRFLAIFTGNLDEFFQVRVAGLCEQVAADATGTNADGLTPAAQLGVIRDIARELTRRQTDILRDEIVPALRTVGIEVVEHDRTSPSEQHHLAEVFADRIFPVLTPLAVDPAHPFPSISNLSLNLAVLIRSEDGIVRFARVKVPPILPRLLRLPGTDRFVPLETVIAAHLDRLFPGVQVLEHHVFRVTRNADFDVEETEADDLLLAIQSELSRRRFGRAVRLEVGPDMSAEILELLLRELEVSADDVDVVPAPLGLSGLSAIADLDRPELRWPSFIPPTAAALAVPAGEDEDVFAALREQDVLVHHPYDAFATSVLAFIEQAARDPDVLAIKVTLYRTSGPGSPIIRALMDAAESGKQVVALVELKARFDEEANITWANALEEAGVHVAYGVVGLKTHTKIALVVRSEPQGVRRYVHIGTGNYNDVTARIYEDLGLLSADPELGADLSDLFNVLTGYARRQDYRRLVVAPTGFRARISELIARETAADDGHIMIKVNALVDPEIIDALYAASAAGTTVDLLVRGICSLRPGVPGLSEHIRVRSIVGRYLEHSRIYRFGSRARGYDHLIGSGDLMPRNLDRRVEALVPVSDPRLAARLDEVLDVSWQDDLLAWELGPDVRWRRVAAVRGIETHATLQERARRRAGGGQPILA